MSCSVAFTHFSGRLSKAIEHKTPYAVTCLTVIVIVTCPSEVPGVICLGLMRGMASEPFVLVAALTGRLMSVYLCLLYTCAVCDLILSVRIWGLSRVDSSLLSIIITYTSTWRQKSNKPIEFSACSFWNYLFWELFS